MYAEVCLASFDSSFSVLSKKESLLNEVLTLKDTPNNREYAFIATNEYSKTVQTEYKISTFPDEMHDLHPISDTI